MTQKWEKENDIEFQDDCTRSEFSALFFQWGSIKRAIMRIVQDIREKL